MLALVARITPLLDMLAQSGCQGTEGSGSSTWLDIHTRHKTKDKEKRRVKESSRQEDSASQDDDTHRLEANPIWLHSRSCTVTRSLIEVPQGWKRC